MTFEHILRKSLCRPAFCSDIKSRLSEIDNVSVAKEYAEPGYSNPDKLILVANWNYFPRDVDSILERYGYSIEWSDEWDMCGNCGKVFRTKPDSFDWTPSFAFVEDDLLCHDCARPVMLASIGSRCEDALQLALDENRTADASDWQLAIDTLDALRRSA